MAKPSAPFALELCTKTRAGNVSYTRLATANTKREALAMFHALEQRLAAHLPPSRRDEDGWVAIYLEEDGNWEEKGRAFLGTKAQAKKALGGRVRADGPAPRRAAAARGGRAPAGVPARPGLLARIKGLRQSEQFAVFIESAKGSAKRIGKALYAHTEAAAIAKAKGILAQIERDVAFHGQHANSAKVRVDVVHVPTRQLVGQTHWVKT